MAASFTPTTTLAQSVAAGSYPLIDPADLSTTATTSVAAGTWAVIEGIRNSTPYTQTLYGQTFPLPTTSASTPTTSSLTATSTASQSSSESNSPSPQLSPTSQASSTVSSSGLPAATDSTASASPSSTSTASSSTGSNTGLIAGIAVVAAVAAIALVALAFVLIRNRRKPSYTQAASSDKDVAYDPAVLALKEKVAHLQDDLNAKDANLRQTQGALLASGRGAGATAVMDDKTVHNNFSRLNKEIADWVLTHFKNARPAASPPRELTSQLIKTQPNYSYLMQEPRTRFLVLRAIVADMIADAMNNGTLYGNEDFTRMHESMSQNADPATLSQWRSLTASLLPTPSSNDGSSASSLAQRIDYSTSTLVNASPSDPNRLQHLTRVVASAQTLTLDLAKQRANFSFERPTNSMFDPVVMEDVLQEKRAEDLRGQKVQSVVFPAVFRFGSQEGGAYGERTVISRASVLVQGAVRGEGWGSVGPEGGAKGM